MKRLSGLSLVLFLAASVAFGQSSRKPAGLTWAPAYLKVDGDLQEWGNPLRFYDTSTRIAYSVANDSANLYLCMRISDEMMKRKVLSVGMTVGIDTLGKKKQQVSITCPLAGSLVFDRMVLHGFRSGNGISRTPADNGVTVKIGRNDLHDLVYEASIPWISFLGRNPTEKETGKMTLEITIPPMPRSARDERLARAESDDDDASLSGMPGGGRLGGRMGGGMRGGMGPGGMNGGFDIRGEQKLRMKFVPATGQTR
jgi:hypothetical protein